MKKCILFMFFIAFLIADFFAEDSNWFMAKTDEANLKSVIATSELVEAQFKGKYLYPPINIFDGNFDNTWCEADANGPGIGESITIEFSEAVSFDEIQIVNGFASKDYYKKNNRVKKLLLTQVAKKHFQQKEYLLDDDCPDWQSIKFELTQTAQTITFKILDVYKGSKYDDTCLDDIRLLYKGKVIPFTGVEELKKIQEENSRLMLSSSAKNFENQFFTLFYGSDKLYLKSQKDNSAIVIVKDENRIYSVNDSSAKFIKVASKADVLKQIGDKYLAEYLSSYLDDYLKEARENNREYLLVGTQTENYNVNWKLGNFRILKTERINYIETTTAVIIKLNGNIVYWNGVPYTVLTEKQIKDCRIWDGY